MNFKWSIYVIKEAVLAIASFFVPKRYRLSLTLKGYIIFRGDTYDSNSPLDAAIKWYEQVLGFMLLTVLYSIDAREENEHNMTTNDLIGDTVKKMRNAHLMADNQVGIELFEFEEPIIAEK